jgi:hypothetical protein
MGEPELFPGQANPGHFGLVSGDGLEFPGRVETVDITIKDQTREAYGCSSGTIRQRGFAGPSAPRERFR